MLNFLIILLICFGILTNNICLRSFSCQKQSNHTPVVCAKLRGFGAGLHLLDIYEMRQKLKKVFEERELERKNKEILIEEAKRRRIYEKYLLGFQARSYILRDFNTNRF
jgi:hypothetical protein